MSTNLRIAHLPLTMERNDDGFLARCASIQGAFAEGDTPTEALANLLDVIRMIGQYRKERGENLFDGVAEDLPAKKKIAFTVPVEV